FQILSGVAAMYVTYTNRGLSMRVSFRPLFRVAQSIQMLRLVFYDPALVYFMNGDRFEIVKLFTASSYRGNQVCVFKPRKMLGDRLSGHVYVRAELSQRLAAVCAQRIQQASPGRVR